MTNQTEITYDDPIFRQFEETVESSLEEINDLIPLNPPIKKDDEWADPEYDRDYEEFCKAHPVQKEDINE